MERLNDNELKEVARMQQMIDSYEGFINEINKIWRWVKEHKDNK